MNDRNITSEQIKNQKIDEVFYYYDEPKLYSCWLDLGSRYIAFWVDEDEVSQEWLYVEVSEQRYREMLMGDFPLYLLFKNPENSNLYKAVLTLQDEYLITKVLPNDIPEDRLPQKDCFIRSRMLPDRSM